MASPPSTASTTACKRLVLDAGPLLSLSPLRGLAETYVTVPQVLAELKDKRAREHFEKLALVTGVKVEIQAPDAASLSHVIQFAKKTGDYSVLSQADLSIIALAYALDVQDKKAKEAVEPSGSSENVPAAPSEDGKERVEENASTAAINAESAQETPDEDSVVEEKVKEEVEEEVQDQTEDNEDQEPLNVELHSLKDDPAPEPSSSSSRPPSPSPNPTSSQRDADDSTLYDDPSESDDGEGEWITPSNVAVHKSRAMGLTPSASGKGKAKARETIAVGCMTADFAMQNVLLQMGLSLVGLEGKRIDRVKTWVLRCHACFKICKDSSKKFCPSCGNPTLLRASVTISSPTAGSNTPALQVHLKPNFHYKTRGTKYSIPAPKSGSAKTGSGEGLILREDQTEYMRASKQAETKREREEKKMLNAALTRGGQGGMGLGNWTDPDWIPEIMASGTSGKGRRNPKGSKDDMPTIGYGRKNPNERKRHK